MMTIPTPTATDRPSPASRRGRFKVDPRYAGSQINGLFRSWVEHGKLTADEERDLARRRDGGCVASRNTLVDRNLPLVVHFARKLCIAWKKPHLHDDLVGVGMIGLIKAADLYDPARGTRFTTFATRLIKQAIQTYPYTDRLIHVPRDVQQAARMSVGPGFLCTPGGARTNWADAIEAARRVAVVSHPDQAVNPDDDRDVLALAPARPESTDALVESEAAARIRAALACLNPAQAAIIRACFGIDEPAVRQCDVALRLGITRSRVGQIYHVALDRLRVAMADMEA